MGALLRRGALSRVLCSEEGELGAPVQLGTLGVDQGVQLWMPVKCWVVIGLAGGGRGALAQEDMLELP